jgi:hypothetical protein
MITRTRSRCFVVLLLLLSKSSLAVTGTAQVDPGPAPMMDPDLAGPSSSDQGNLEFPTGRTNPYLDHPSGAGHSGSSHSGAPYSPDNPYLPPQNPTPSLQSPPFGGSTDSSSIFADQQPISTSYHAPNYVSPPEPPHANFAPPVTTPYSQSSMAFQLAMIYQWQLTWMERSNQIRDQLNSEFGQINSEIASLRDIYIRGGTLAGVHKITEVKNLIDRTKNSVQQFKEEANPGYYQPLIEYLIACESHLRSLQANMKPLETWGPLIQEARQKVSPNPIRRYHPQAIDEIRHRMNHWMGKDLNDHQRATLDLINRFGRELSQLAEYGDANNCQEFRETQKELLAEALRELNAVVDAAPQGGDRYHQANDRAQSALKKALLHKQWGPIVYQSKDQISHNSIRRYNAPAVDAIRQQINQWKTTDLNDHQRATLDLINRYGVEVEKIAERIDQGVPEDYRSAENILIGAGFESLNDVASAAPEGGDSYHEAYDVATTILDIATGLAPGVSAIRDIYEAVTGYHMITGEALSDLERALAIVNIVTLGVGKTPIKAIEKAAKVAQESWKAQRTERNLARSAEEAKRILDSAGGTARNRAAFERYLRDMRETMQRPHVENPHLAEMMAKHYRPAAEIGSGSTAAAIRYERATGELVGGSSHIQKGQNDIVFFRRWLEENPMAAAGDRAAAENVLKDLEDALRGL